MSTNSPLLTDLYQLTMGQAYWHHKRHEQEAVFHLFFRKAPFQEDAAIAAGIEPAMDYLTQLKFDDCEIRYLSALKAADGSALFAKGYLETLRHLDWNLQIKAIPEGSLVLPNAPLLQVRGPILQCQLVETALLNIVNFQTLIATQAALICEAAQGDSVLEFGLRRAQGPDGGLSASRAAYVGGCDATSNVLAGHQFGIPVKGTHAHSWVMSFHNELTAFQHYANAMPNNTTLLVDTFDSIEGTKKAIQVGEELRKKGYHFGGIRLDSGDLTALSITARTLLDEAGFQDAHIVASNDLDASTIRRLKAEGAKIDTWGVGTKLATAYEQAALGGVYKLGAIREQEDWHYRIKLSDDPIKISNPGCLNVIRHSNHDLLYNELEELPSTQTLLETKIVDSKREMPSDSLEKIRERALVGWSEHRHHPRQLRLSPNLEITKKKLLRQHQQQ